jgi:hypothetical protein
MVISLVTQLVSTILSILPLSLIVTQVVTTILLLSLVVTPTFPLRMFPSGVKSCSRTIHHDSTLLIG